MAVRGYILVRTEAGKDQVVAACMRDVEHPGARVLHCDAVVGPYDVVIELEADNLEVLGEALGRTIQTVPGVAATTTCLV
ncbi:MAG: Lrp/AsnC ligand binding domain-containing protein, partial [Dehalococcoidia bacterium]|nr:Lrp/AsnC ligand binding domain-containing protein [Dehalococcoidia bacterium]